jgi:hypothetical protein
MSDNQRLLTTNLIGKAEQIKDNANYIHETAESA